MKKAVLMILIGMLVVSSFILITSCSKKDDVITIGAILPLTGPAASFGQSCEQGIQLALDEINSSGNKLNVIIDNSEASPTKAVSIAKKMISIDNVPIILCLTTGETTALAPIADEKNFILITGTINPGAADLGTNVFRNASNLEQDAFKIMEYWIKNNIKKVSIIGLNLDAHISIQNLLVKEFPKNGGEIVLIENSFKGNTDFRTILQKIKNSQTEAVYILGYQEIGYILKQAYELGLKTKFFADPSMESDEVLSIAGKSAESVIYTRAAFNSESNDRIIREFVNSFNKKYNRNPDVFAAQFYDNIMILNGILKQKIYTYNEIRNALLNIKNYPGVSGKTSFLPNGDVKKPIMLKTVKNGKFVIFNEQ